MELLVCRMGGLQEPDTWLKNLGPTCCGKGGTLIVMGWTCMGLLCVCVGLDPSGFSVNLNSRAWLGVFEDPPICSHLETSWPLLRGEQGYWTGFSLLAVNFLLRSFSGLWKMLSAAACLLRLCILASHCVWERALSRGTWRRSQRLRAQINNRLSAALGGCQEKLS